MKTKPEWCVHSIILCLTIIPVAFGASLSGYHIGNSLTWDCKLTFMPAVFENEGFDYNQGYHIDCSMSLTSIVDDPNKEICEPGPISYGAWNTALSAHDWDYITLQGYPGPLGTTGDSEVSATTILINESLNEGRNTNCIFFLYFSWPQTNSASDFSEQINLPYTNGNDRPILSKEFADFWYSAVTQSLPNLDIRLIPTGHILEALDQKLREIPVGDLANTYDLYRDKDHLDWSSGRYVSHATMLSEILGKPPSQIAFPTDGSYDFINDVDPELVQLSNEVIWSVLTQDKRTKISDLPSISIRTNKIGGLEVSFVENLMASTNLNSSAWVVTNSISPHRLFTSPESKAKFFWARQADGL